MIFWEVQTIEHMELVVELTRLHNIKAHASINLNYAIKFCHQGMFRPTRNMRNRFVRRSRGRNINRSNAGALRFSLGGCREQTQKEVADKLGISQSYISRLEKRIISRLKKEILRLS